MTKNSDKIGHTHLENTKQLTKQEEQLEARFLFYQLLFLKNKRSSRRLFSNRLGPL